MTPLLVLSLPALAGWRLHLGDQDLGPLSAPRPGAFEGRTGWEVGPDGRPRPAAPPLAARDALIVLTTREIAAGSKVLPRFLDAREAEGFQVALATEDDWDLTGEEGRAERIRAWLQAGWAGSPGAFLLLIGDPDPEGDGVPMKMVHPLAEIVGSYPDWLAAEMDPIPTDFVYADLDGDWDCDGDGRWGEYPDDAALEGSGALCVDFGPELFVGRIPSGDPETVDRLLERALARDFEQDKSWRHGVLLPGALFGIEGAPEVTGGVYAENSDGASILATIYRDLPAAFQEDAWRLFEEDGEVTSPYPHDGPLVRDEVVDRWNDGRGIVVWAGHGGPEGVYRAVWSEDRDGDGEVDESECAYPAFLESGDTDDLADAPGAFTFHVSCDNGFPEEPENIGAALLEGGAAATATASRPAFGVTVAMGETWEPRPELVSSSDVARYYALLLAEGATAGEALAWTKANLPGDGWADEYGRIDLTGIAWATHVEFNLYGDPTRSLELCAADAECDDGSPCNGEETCSGGLCVHGDPVDCAGLDGDCAAGTCDDATGACTAAPRFDGTPCDDGAWCTEQDACRSGECAGEPRDCGSREGWESWCEEETASCESAPVVVEGEGRAGGCATGPAPRGAFLLGLVAAAGRARRRRAR